MFKKNCVVRGGAHTGSTRHVGHFWSIVPALGHCEDGEFDHKDLGNHLLQLCPKVVKHSV
jgi:hypothetical protein